MIKDQALAVLENNRVAIFIVAYNAEKHIEKVLNRIPGWVAEKLAEIFIIDDCSTDETVVAVEKYQWSKAYAPLKIYKTPENQGYGGNQKIGFSYAISQGFDIVILLHGDGQYAPEALPEILAPYADGADAVFGSRFLASKAAIKGGMPLYKYIGNRILTTIQNAGMSANLSEWHSGYRSYRVDLLRRVPFRRNSNNFEFDGEIIIQILGSGYRIVETPIPTYYGDEVCHVNGMRYAYKCVHAILQYKFMQVELFFDPKFDLVQRTQDTYRYIRKNAPTTVHHKIRELSFPSGCRILDIGGGDGRAVARDLAKKDCAVTCIDKYIPAQSLAGEYLEVDLDAPWDAQFSSDDFQAAFALDVIEHLKEPEIGIVEIYNRLANGGKLYASTGNVAYFPIRIMLLFGFFNYGRKGILDLTHSRLFTLGAFRRLISQGGFEILKIESFGPPIRDLLNNSSYLIVIIDNFLYWLANLWPALFAYQFLVHAQKKPDLSVLTEKTVSFVSGASIKA